MEFGGISDQKKLNRLSKQIKAGTYQLPENDICRELGQSKKKSSLKLWIGPPVWSHPQWRGSVYPKQAKAQDFLKIFSRQFNSIELNSSFYRVPDLKTIRDWCDQTPKNFRFAPKLYQGISYKAESAPKLNDFYRKISHLEDRLGLSFLQLPPNLSKLQFPALQGLLKKKPKDFQLAVEFRHPSWFEDGKLTTEVFDFFSAHSIGSVMTDALGRGDVLHSSITSPQVMIRYLGNEMHSSDFMRMDIWVKKIGSWMKSGVTEVYFFPHLKGYDEVPQQVSEMIRRLNAAYETELKDWEPATSVADGAMSDKRRPRSK